METKFYDLSDLFELKNQLLRGDEKAIDKTISELRRLEEVIKDYEIGMKIMNEKFNCKTLKETTK